MSNRNNTRFYETKKSAKKKTFLKVIMCILILSIVAVGGYWGYVELKPPTTTNVEVPVDDDNIIIPDPDVVGGEGTEPTYSFIDSAE